MIGNQKSSAVLRNEKCSTRCHPGERSASSYITGRCQATLTEMKADQQKAECDTNRATLRSTADERNGPSALSEKLRGGPARKGRYGAAHRMSGGSTIIRSRC